MLINLTNHSSIGWGETQLQSAQNQFKEVHDWPFPSISPHASTNEVKLLAQNIAEEIVSKYGVDIKIHIMGEFTFVYSALCYFETLHIECFASTTDRIEKILENGNKVSTFKFIQFRSYFNEK